MRDRLNSWWKSKDAERRRSDGFVCVGLAALVVGGSLAVVFGSPSHARLVNLLGGHGWVANDRAGQVVLANGASGTVDLYLDVPGHAGQELRVVVAGDDADFYDASRNQLASINVAHLALGHTTDLPSGTQVLAGNNLIFVIQLSTGMVRALNPLNNRQVSVYPFNGPVSPAVVDGDSLYLEVRRTGALIRLALVHGALRMIQETPIVAPTDIVDLGVDNGSPDVLDTTAENFFVVRSGSVGPAVHVPIANGAVPMLAGDVTGSVVPIAMSGTGQLTLIAGTHRSSVGLSVGSAALLAPVSYGGRIYVPVPRHEEVLVLSDHGLPAPSPIHVGGPSGQLDVYTQGGYLWLNNPNGGSAFAVLPTGAKVSISKNVAGVPHNTPKSIRHHTGPATTSTTVAANTHPTSPGTSGTNPVTTVTPKAPSAPADIFASAGNGYIDVTWGPALPNGDQILGYYASYSSIKRTRLGTAAGTVRLTKEISNGHTYRISVWAVNAVAPGPPVTSAAVHPSASVPSPPRDLKAHATDQATVDISWTKPSYNGVFITGYEIYVLEGSDGSAQPVARAQPAQTHATITTGEGLVVGTQYRFTLKALSDGGADSAYSADSVPLTVVKAPGPVTMLLAQPTSQATITATWTCDITCEGGEPSVLFTVEALTGDNTPAGTATQSSDGSNYQAIITGLADNTSYVVSVTARNAIGPSPEPTLSVPVQSAGPPTSLTISVVQAENDFGTGDTHASLAAAQDDSPPVMEVDVAIVAGSSPITGCTFPGADWSGPAPTCTSIGVSGDFDVTFPLWAITTNQVQATVTLSNYPTQSASFNIPTPAKVLTVDALPYFPGDGTYSGGNAHSFANHAFVKPTPGVQPLWNEGTTVEVQCWSSGGATSGTNSPPTRSTTWVQLTSTYSTSYTWMNTIYFSDVNASDDPSAEDALPICP